MDCPICNSKEHSIPIMYGEPGPEVIHMAKKGKAYIGGYTFLSHMPTNFCKKCQVKFNERGNFTHLTGFESGYIGPEVEDVLA